jgi:ComF family protein
VHLPTLAHRVLDFCFPQQCPCCEAFHESATLLCDECEAEMAKLSAAPRCEQCAMPAKEHGAPCPHCMSRGLGPFDRVVCVGVLRDPIKAVIHQAKYAGRWTLEEYLADCALQREDMRELLGTADCLAPVPLHRRRQVQRGYNQSDVVARRMAGKLTVVRPAVRVRDTRTQTELRSREARAENLHDAFLLVRPKQIADRHVVLVDDVLTSGATLLSLARTLKAAGPASLSAIVMAVADPKGRAFEVI